VAAVVALEAGLQMSQSLLVAEALADTLKLLLVSLADKH
jgi:hypothetical protein